MPLRNKYISFQFYTCFRGLVRAGTYNVHGLIPASCVYADRYNREEVVASLGREINLNPPLTLGQLPDTSEELLKLDHVKILLYRSIFTQKQIIFHAQAQYSLKIALCLQKLKSNTYHVLHSS